MADIGSSAIRIVGIVALLFIALVKGADDLYSNSHISPNSAVDKNPNPSEPLPSIKSSKIEALVLSDAINHYPIESSDQTQSHVIVTRSVANPVLTRTDGFDDDILVFKNFADQIDHNDVELSGRSVNLIQPTKTYKDSGKMRKVLATEVVETAPFPGEYKGAPQARALVEPQEVIPSAVMTSSFVTYSPDTVKGRQASPDIQDIITGIVKLLNGNVNVQANTAPAMGRPLRPITTRINNRGPPRITDGSPLPPDFDLPAPLAPPPLGPKPPSTTKMPTPYPFEVPHQNTSPIKPFLNGIPLPEQLVPAGPHRPGIRRPPNIPPWKRPQRRPPHPQRRPQGNIPAYKPMPQYPGELAYIPDDPVTFSNNSQDVLTLDMGSDMQIIPITDEPVETQTDVESNESIPIDVTTQTEPSETPVIEKEYIPKDKDTQPEKKKDKEKSSLKMDKHNSKYIINTSSEVNEKYKPEITATTTIVEPGLTSTHDLNITSIFDKLGEGIGEVTPILDSSIQEVISSVTEPKTTTSSSTPTEALPTITTTTSLIEESTQSTMETSSSTTKDQSPNTGFPYYPYRPRPGIVLDDTEYKPGGHRAPAIITARPPIGQIGEIFDVTVSAIQGPGGGSNSGTGKPFIIPVDIEQVHVGSKDVITAPSGSEGFVSIDGKRTYLNLFGDAVATPTSTISATSVKTSTSSVTATGYAVPHTESPRPKPTPRRPGYNRRPSQPPVRIDTCIVGDDSTCDQTQNEVCRTELGVSSCHCRPGYARRKHREPCRRVVAVLMSLRVDRLYEHRISWGSDLSDISSEHYQQLAFETTRAIDSAMSMTPFSDEFMGARVNSVYKGERAAGQAGVFVNLTLQLEENGQTASPQVRADIQRHLLGVIQRRSNNVGNSALWVDSPPGSISNLQDVDECSSSELHDCHVLATCINIFGGFQCACGDGYRDPWADNRHRAGRQCEQCSAQYCNNRGECKYSQGQQVCVCSGNYYGSQCEVDGEVLGVAVGASVAAVVIIVLTLVCLVMWSRRWSREQKTAVGSPVFGYMATAGSTVKTPNVGGPPYQVSMEDRLRWAQIADVMAQANHYAQPEPGGLPTRPSSAVFGYPNLSMAGTLQHGHGTMHGTLPPIPMPRLTLQSHRAASCHGMRPLDNSSSSEEEDRTDLLGRNFHVPRPKSRSNASIANQSGIYYDVDYEQNDIYKHIPGPGIPMSTYTAGRAPFYRN